MYVFGVVLESPFEEAVARVKEALGAEKLGLVLERVVEMPANNLSVILRKP